MKEFLSSKELFALVEVMLGARAFSKDELLKLTGKLKQFTTPEDRQKLNELIRKEMYHYPEIKHDCDSVQDNLWQLVNCINEKREISIDYYRMDRKWVTHRLRPASVLFTDFYFYLIAFLTEGRTEKPYYFRIDRIRQITVHRKKSITNHTPDFDEGLLRQRSLFMWPGKLQTIRFEFTGPSVQAVLDKLPTAKIIDRQEKKWLIEAEVYGNGIKMWLLSQGAWVKVLSPEHFVAEIKAEIEKMRSAYND
jgi:predicted DNA-binding transcriptional regulator YafY